MGRNSSETCGKCASRGYSAENCTQNQIKCRYCHSTNHISGDKNCSKYNELFLMNKIAFKNQVPWEEANMTYAEIARTGKRKTVENSNPLF